MFRQSRILLLIATVAVAYFGSLSSFYLTPAVAERVLGCPRQRDSAEVFAGGTNRIEFQNSARYETVTFVSELGVPSIPREEEMTALNEAVKQAKLGTVLQGLSMREFGTVLIRLAPNVNIEGGLQHILGRNAVAGRDRARGIGNPIFDAGDVDYILVNQIIVQFRAETGQRDIDALLAGYCAREVDRRERAGGWRYLMTFDDQTARHALVMTNRLNKEDIVEFAQPDFIIVAAEHMQSGPTSGPAPACLAAQPTGSTDPYFSKQWYLDHSSPGLLGDPNADINAPAAWGVTEGENIILAILDDAVETTHEDLSTKIHSQWNSFTGNDDLGITDQDKHGTPVAGIAGAITGNGQGIKATAPQVKLMPVRVIRWIPGQVGVSEYPYSVVVDGIETASSVGAHVISMSLSLGAYDLGSCDNRYPPVCQGHLSTAVDNAIANGTVLVFATGNDGGDLAFPAILAGSKHVIAVGATDIFDKIKKRNTSIPNDWGSNHGPQISVVAPGIEIVTTDRTAAKGYCSGNYVRFLGTSAATPIVAGVAALMQSQYKSQGLPLLLPEELKSRMQETAADLVPLGFDNDSGHGRVDACKALQDGSCGNRLNRWLMYAALTVAVGAVLWWWMRRATIRAKRD